MSPEIRIWGHRGCRGEGNPPENTVEAILEAIRQGADGVEFDVRLTSDDVAVVFHDRTLERLTDGKGRVRETPFMELRQLHVYNKQEKMAASYDDPRIPTLAEVLDAIEPHLSEYYWSKGRPFKVNIEIKGKEAPHAVAEEIQRRLAGGQWGMQHFHVSGFKMDRLAIIRELLPEIEIGALYVEGLGERLKRWQIGALVTRALKETEELKPFSLNLPIEYYADTKIAGSIHKAKHHPVAWTYNEQVPLYTGEEKIPSALRRILEDGITIITDYPRQMRQALEHAVRAIGAEANEKSYRNREWGGRS